MTFLSKLFGVKQSPRAEVTTKELTWTSATSIQQQPVSIHEAVRIGDLECREELALRETLADSSSSSSSSGCSICRTSFSDLRTACAAAWR